MEMLKWLLLYRYSLLMPLPLTIPGGANDEIEVLLIYAGLMSVYGVG